jgi:TonB family protein
MGRFFSNSIPYVCLWIVLTARVADVLAQPAQPAQTAPDTPPAAPSSPTEPAPAPPVVTPPQLETFAEATYPPEALAAGLQARVELELVIGVDGAVSQLRVVEPMGNGFDEAALEAGQRLKFKPAARDGVPMAARIRFPYVFEIKVEEAPAPEPETPPPAQLAGHVLMQSVKVPLANARVALVGADGQTVGSVTTDAEGAFSFGEQPAGEYDLHVSHADYLDFSAHETLVAGDHTDVTYRLEEPPDPEAFGATARVAPPPREVTRRSIERTQLTRMAGTRGDALRTVELMPGVARPPLGIGALIVRGSSPEDSITLFEGLPVPLLYHFGGLTSFINSRLLESVDFYPGNFSARYGRRRGGIVDVQARDPAKDKFHAMADVNLIDASALVEAPIAKNWEFAAAARRSYLDVVFKEVLSSDDVSTLAAPVYYDYQAITTYRPNDNDRLRLMVYGSQDHLALLFTKPDDVLATGDFDLSTEFHRVHASWDRALTKDVDQDIELAVGHIKVGIGLGQGFSFQLSGTEIYGRSEWRGRVNDHIRVMGGLDFYVIPGQFSYIGPPAEATEGNANNGPANAPLSNRDRVETSSDFTVAQPAAYVEGDFNYEPVRVVLGTRVDYYNDVDAVAVDPRITGHYAIADGVDIKAGVGMFSQPPQFQESDKGLGNPDLDPTSTLHVGTGVDYQVTDSLYTGVDLFYKYLYNVIVGTALGEPPRFVNEGEGRVYGMELSARLDPKGRYFGYLSYTLSRSERSVRGGPWQLFDFDQSHILTLSAVYRLGRGWEAGATFRVISGNPSTPVVGGLFNGDTGQWSPRYGVLNSERNPTFHRLDLRLEKQWTFPAWKLAGYLDVQNVYNAENPEGKIYDYEFRESTTIRGLPIFPNLGFRGEM